MRWIGLHLPRLSLEAYAAVLPDALRRGPVALLQGHTIVSVDAAGRRLGVQPGQQRATALALAPQLHLGQADPARDAEAAAAVAHAALAFTPAVTPALLEDGGATVLLEVQASLRYFGGFESLQQRLRAALAPFGHRLHLASAPTAQGAVLLARGRVELHCEDLPSLRRALAALPVWLLGPGREHWEALQGMGLRTLGDLRRLPRPGLARRFGEALLDEIDRAWGERPDPRAWLTPPPRFESRLELFARADTTEQVLHGASRLIDRLVAWAAAQQGQVRMCELEMQHEGLPSTRLELSLAVPSREAAHLRMLLRERLAQCRLAAPTLELWLRCAGLVRGAPPPAELFPTPRSEQEGLALLIERLRIRLGPERLTQLVRVHDHRPERASAQRPLQSLDGLPARRATGTGGPQPRPVWLLPEPLPLAERGALPCLDGRPLQLLCGPERIETGWWDGDLVERDYYIAEAAEGALVWVYRRRLPQPDDDHDAGGWFLQGRFG